MAIRRKRRYAEEEEEAAQTFEVPVFKDPVEGFVAPITASEPTTVIESGGDERLETNKDLQFGDSIDRP